MPTRAAPEQDRVTLDDAARKLLTLGNAKAARQAARQSVEHTLKAISDADPALGLWVDAYVTGVLEGMDAALPGFKPPGYREGLPTIADLLATYEIARAETATRR